MIAEFFGYLTGILIVLSMIPQVMKNWKEKSAKDISLIRSIVYVLGVSSFIVYGLLIQNGPILFMNFFGLCLGIGSLILKIIYG